MILAALLLTGCSLRASRAGLLDVEPSRMVIIEQDGRRSRLVTDAYGAELHYLDGCSVEVSGPRLGKRLYVREWVVTDAGDGSQPFVGPLVRMGARWAIEDWSSGTTVMLAGGNLSGLAAHAGQSVLVVGFVAGPQEVTVVSWRALAGAEGQGD